MAEWSTVTRADLDKQPHEVAEMFDGVAQRYDLTNTVLSMGQDRGWRRATRSALALRPGERGLDVGAGPGGGVRGRRRPVDRHAPGGPVGAPARAAARR